MKKLLFIFLQFLICAVFLTAQSRFELQNHTHYYNSKLISLASFVEKFSTDSLKLYLYYKLPINNYLLRPISNGDFQGIANLTLTLSDQDGVVRFHRLFTDTIVSPKSQFLPNELVFQEGYTSLIIPKDYYQLEVRVNDVNSRKSEKVSIGYLLLDTARKTNASLMILNKFSENQLKPICLFNNSDYSNSPKTILINLFVNTEFSNLTYKIQKIKSEDEYNFELSDLNGKVEKIKVEDVQFTSEFVELNYNSKATTEKEESGNNYYVIDFIHNPFVPGRYQLEIYSGNRIVYTTTFRVIWDNQPITLYNMNVALKISEIFLTNEEIDLVRSYNKRLQFKGLYDVWKKLDTTTPLDNYPESMIEFYQRADFAYYSFSTFAERNGALTDKGKVYILNGSPDKIEEVFKMKKLNEIWTYSNLIKEYTFESVEAGVLKLVNIKE